MPSTTRLFGLILIALGIGSYTMTGQTSLTAMIPAFFGAAFLVCAMAARREAARRHAMHAAVALGLIGAVASLAHVHIAISRGLARYLADTEGFDESSFDIVHYGIAPREFSEDMIKLRHRMRQLSPSWVLGADGVAAMRKQVADNLNAAFDFYQGDFWPREIGKANHHTFAWNAL